MGGQLAYPSPPLSINFFVRRERRKKKATKILKTLAFLAQRERYLGRLPLLLFTDFSRVGQDRIGQDRIGQVRLGQVRLGQVRLAQVRLGQVRLGQVLASRQQQLCPIETKDNFFLKITKILQKKKNTLAFLAQRERVARRKAS